MKKRIHLPIIAVIILLIYFSGCSDNYENHALAIRNNTSQIITMERYTGTSLPREIEINPGAYGKFYETSTDLWLTPPTELKKVSDSILIYVDTTIITCTLFEASHYDTNPYSNNATWLTEIIEFETSSFIGKKIDRTYIHIFEINQESIIP
jgi:hypothetical protein